MNKKQLLEKILDIKKRLNEAVLALDLTEKESEHDVLQEQTQKTDFWQDQENAKLVLEKISGLKNIIEPWRKLQAEINELSEIFEETDEEDGTMLLEIEKKLVELENELSKKETETYFSGKYDNLAAVLSIYSGAGGVDAQDWAEMLLSMFMKYFGTKNLSPTIIHLTPGSEAGIKSATIEVRGPFAYGTLRSERGVHRLVRISPYDADKARHTSFALVEVIPEIEATDISIPESELKIDTFRASGHGGQSVNTTDSAVRITHLPTGATVSVQNERSQLQNREKAMKILKARIAAIRESEREKELKVIRGESLSAEWGSQIRSYVLHPYTMVKDHRTGVETADVQGVLGGNLDPFIEGYLKLNRE